MTTDYTKLDGPELLRECGTDGDKWAEAFVQYNPDCNIDQHTAMGWFANAIMNTHDIMNGTIHNGDHLQWILDNHPKDLQKST